MRWLHSHAQTKEPSACDHNGKVRYGGIVIQRMVLFCHRHQNPPILSELFVDLFMPLHAVFTPPVWLTGSGNAQTIWSARLARRVHGQALSFRRERWSTPDGDFIDADWLEPGAASGSSIAKEQPLLVLFHGLEGSSASHYSQAFADACVRRGWRFVMPHFRGCSGTLNLAPRAYHCGDFEEIDWMLERCCSAHAGKVYAAGVSLGGNALLRWVQEAGKTAERRVRAVASVSAPLDLPASGAALGRGFNRQVYTRIFLNTLKPKALSMLLQHPGLFDREALVAARDLFAYDNLVTAPLHGYLDVNDYWRRAAARPHLHKVCLPALLVNARNDPFVPAAALPGPEEVSRHVVLWQPANGGHAGFATGAWPSHLSRLPEAVLDWMACHG